jgi:hypothetical protein
MFLRLLSAGLAMSFLVGVVGCSACHHGGTCCASPAVVGAAPLPPAPCGCGAPGAVPPPPAAVGAPAYSVPVPPGAVPIH